MFHWVFEAGVDERAGWTTLGDPASARRTTQFRSYRGGSRWHAACDLVVPRGTPVLAVCGGEVLSRSHFYEGTWQVTVRHAHDGYAPFVVRYGEVLAPEDGGTVPAVGASIAAGSEIGQVGQLGGGGHMLHFELYASGASAPSLSIATRLNQPPADYTDEQRETIVERGWDPDFQRRADLANPSAFLQALKAGEAPPAPTRYRLAVAPSADVVFTEEEVEPIIVMRRRHAGAHASGIGLPSWWSTFTGLPDDDVDDVGQLRWRRRGP